jgi:hypothetical protein
MAASDRDVAPELGFDDLTLRLDDLRRSLSDPHGSATDRPVAPVHEPAAATVDEPLFSDLDPDLDAALDSVDGPSVDGPLEPDALPEIAAESRAPFDVVSTASQRPPVWDLVLLGGAWAGFVALLVGLAAS